MRSRQSARGYRRSSQLLLAMAIVCLHAQAYAQEVSVQASVDQTTIGTEETVTFTIEVSGRSLPDVPSLQPPETRGLALANRFPFTSQNMSIVNGRVEQSVGYSWTYKPVKEGSGVFLPMELEISGKKYRTPQIAVTVVPQSQRPRQTQRRNPFLLDPFGRQQEPVEQREITDKDMFIRAVPNKRTAYQNEQIIIEYALYFRTGIQLRQSRLADSWDAEGFWREELEIESRPVPKAVVVDGLRYNTITLKRVAVFPARTGELKIDPLRIESEASLPFGSGDPFFSLRNRYQPVRLSSPPITITVLPWPSDPPVSFSGAVGDFQLVSSSDRRGLDVGESLQVKLTISGTGNVSTIEPPVFRVPGVFEAYDPEVAVRVDRTGAYVRGAKTFTYVLVPRANGNFEIPPFELSFFNPASKAYETKRSEPIPVTITGTADALAESVDTPAGLSLDDIAPQKSSDVRWKPVESSPLHQSPVPYLMLVLPLLGLIGVRVWKGHADKLAGDVQYARRRRAHPLARRHLKAAETLLESNSPAEFYEELERAVLGFIGDRLNISELGLTHEQLVECLRSEGLPSDACDDVASLLQECDRGRFAPIKHERPSMENARNLALDLIVRLDAAFTNTHSTA